MLVTALVSIATDLGCLLPIDKIPRCSMLGAEMADAWSKDEFEMFRDSGAEYSGRLLVISDWVSRPIFQWLHQPLPDHNIGKRIC
jgi:hypothetical protein